MPNTNLHQAYLTLKTAFPTYDFTIQNIEVMDWSANDAEPEHIRKVEIQAMVPVLKTQKLTFVDFEAKTLKLALNKTLKGLANNQVEQKAEEDNS